jgi:transcriptional regulator with XRE-family HTH domain
MSWPDPDLKASQTTFAMMVGVSQQAISQLKNKNVLPDGGTYADWLIAYLDRLRAEAAGRMQDEKLSHVRIRETEMSANLKELEYLEKLKQIIFVDDIAPLLNEFCTAVQFHVMSAQERIIEAVESKHEITLNDDDINKPLRAAIESVASGAGELIARISSSDDSVEAAEESDND